MKKQTYPSKQQKRNYVYGRALRDIQKTAARETMGSRSPRTKQKDNLMIFMGVKPYSDTWL